MSCHWKYTDKYTSLPIYSSALQWVFLSCKRCKFRLILWFLLHFLLRRLQIDGQNVNTIQHNIPSQDQTKGSHHWVSWTVVTRCVCWQIPTLSARLPLEPKTSFPVVLRDELPCDMVAVDGWTLLVTLACRFAGDEASTSLSLEAFPSRRLPEPVKGMNLGSSAGASAKTTKKEL